MNYEIYRTILDRILFFDYPPGKILNEHILAGEFGVSRTPVREVLNRLEWEQLVRIVPRTGTIVEDIDFQKITHVYQIRLAIEELAGRLAGRNVTNHHLDQIEQVRQECEQLFNSRNQRSLIKADYKFRHVLYDAANNPLLTDISQYLYNLTIRLSYILFERSDWNEQVQTSFDEYTQIYESLSRKDSKEIAKLRRNWLTVHIKRIKSKF